ncbi:S1 family peptidase [Empedobacter brevis]|uniref:S1 family peptidase n=1 Tax=Empedobacter brevis TaxID=247 RepID=UPI0028ABF92C|nr:serine protease [Empedobacter brevis]
MAENRYNIYKEHLDLINEILDYFLSEVFDITKFREIKINAISNNSKMPNSNPKHVVEMGYLSFNNFLCYTSDKNNGEVNINTNILNNFLQLLCSKNYLTELPYRLNVIEPSFKFNIYKPIQYFNKKLILNDIFGWEYIIKKYSNSIFKIENIDRNGDPSLGTGFYYFQDNKHTIVTNKHVIEQAEKISVYKKDDSKIDYHEIKIDDSLDLAFLTFTPDIDSLDFDFDYNLEILSEIITIGYPSIPMTKFAYQACHKGEINSFVENYEDENRFLISAKTSSGNSGSPIINNYGMVVGIITEELFDKDAFKEKGKLPYYAAITSMDIFNSFNKLFN